MAGRPLRGPVDIEGQSMPKLTVVDRSGTERTIEVENGLTVMEAIRDNGFDELLAAAAAVPAPPAMSMSIPPSPTSCPR